MLIPAGNEVPTQRGKAEKGEGAAAAGSVRSKGEMGFFGKSVDAAGMGALALENA